MSGNDVLFVRSSKKNSKTSEGDSSTNDDDDIWDDTLLIEAYEKAVQIAQQSYFKKKQTSDNMIDSKFKKKTNGQQKWKVGDKCRCQYSEDLNYYEADIIKIIGSSGMCIVKYVGYENEEEVCLKDLLPSEGNAARSLQCQEALQNGDNEMDVESDIQSNSEKKLHLNNKKPFTKKKDGHSKHRISGISNSFSAFNFPIPHMLNDIPPPPPPPPPHMFKTITEDENETEAMSAMLISWYMSGYHTGYYHGLKMAKKKC